MKNVRSALIALAVLLMATAAHAQQIRATATVPFNFIVGDRAYPAGDYSFNDNGVVLRIGNAEKSWGDIILTQPCESATPSAKSELVFDRMGGAYFLRQIWVAGDRSGRELPRSHSEVRLAQNHETTPVIVATNISH